MAAVGNGLKVSIGWNDTPIKAGPLQALQKLGMALFVGSYAHDPGEPLQHRDLAQCMFINPTDDSLREAHRTDSDTIYVVPVRGNPQMQFLAFAGVQTGMLGGNFVLAGRACLACSLKVCRLSDSRFLVC